jgi:hypothetical protein
MDWQLGVDGKELQKYYLQMLTSGRIIPESSPEVDSYRLVILFRTPAKCHHSDVTLPNAEDE